MRANLTISSDESRVLYGYMRAR